MAIFYFLLSVVLSLSPAWATPESVLAEGIDGLEVNWHLPAEVQFPDKHSPVEGTLYLTQTPTPLLPPYAFFEPTGSTEPPILLPRLGAQLAQIAEYKSTAVVPERNYTRRGILQRLVFQVHKERLYLPAGFTSVIIDDFLVIDWVDGDYEILNSNVPIEERHRTTRRLTINEVVNPFRKEGLCHWALSRIGAVLF